MFCTNCGRELSDEYEYCPECGKKITDDNSSLCDLQASFSDYNGKTKRCTKCGEHMPVDSFYCLNCGSPFSDEYADFYKITNRIKMQTGIWKSKWVSLFLCVFLGWIGIHRFYEGKVITGLLYLFTFGFFGIGWLFDIIRIAIKPNPYRVK